MYGIIFNGMPSEELIRAGGGHRIATHLRKLGWNIEVVDYFTSWEITDLIRFIQTKDKQHTVKWIGFSTTWVYRHNNVKGLIIYLKKYFPHIKILVGGNNVFSVDVQADYYIYGFGERAAEAILKYEFSNGDKPKGKALFDGWIIDALVHYPAWPLPDYLNLYEERDFLEPSDVVTMEFGRGCRFKCKFCNFPVLGVKEDTSMNQDIMRDYFIQMYNNWGIKNYSIADETINERTSKLVKIANAVKQSNVDPNFTGFIRLDLFNSHPEHLELMAESRIWGHYYGIETLNHLSGKIIGKGLDPDITKSLMLETRKYFLDNLGLYRGSAGLIAGLPYETEENLLDTFNWLKENWTDQNWAMHCLEIMRGDNFRLSAFGEDFKKFGYNEMTQAEIDAYVAENNYRYHPGRNLSRGIPHIIWKNTNGNYFNFTDIALRFDGESANCAESNWDIFEYIARGISPKESISIKMPTDQEDVLATIRQQRYIEKKLSTL